MDQGEETNCQMRKEEEEEEVGTERKTKTNHNLTSMITSERSNEMDM